ncbi:MAG: Ycf66 family protein [Microcystaceae cyanobacterium]
MVNFGLTSASILGIFLALAGAGLYFLRSVRPEVSRDYDIFFSAVGLLCGLILFFQGWRLDPILQFGQLLLAGSTVFFAVETIRLRGITTEQARRSSPYADDRRVSKTRVYTEAELDQLEPYEEEDPYQDKRRLRGYAEPRSNRSSGYEEEEPRPSRNRRPSGSNRPERPDRPERPERPESNRPPRRPRSESNTYAGWDEDVWEEEAPRRRPRPRPDRDAPREEDTYRPERPEGSRPPRRPRPETPKPNLYEDEPPAAYVDYQPLEEEDFSPESTAPEDSPRKTGDRPKDETDRFDYQ